MCQACNYYNAPGFKGEDSKQGNSFARPKRTKDSIPPLFNAVFEICPLPFIQSFSRSPQPLTSAAPIAKLLKEKSLREREREREKGKGEEKFSLLFSLGVAAEKIVFSCVSLPPSLHSGTSEKCRGEPEILDQSFLRPPSLARRHTSTRKRMDFIRGKVFSLVFCMRAKIGMLPDHTGLGCRISSENKNLKKTESSVDLGSYLRGSTFLSLLLFLPICRPNLICVSFLASASSGVPFVFRRYKQNLLFSRYHK